MSSWNQDPGSGDKEKNADSAVIYEVNLMAGLWKLKQREGSKMAPTFLHEPSDGSGTLYRGGLQQETQV